MEHLTHSQVDFEALKLGDPTFAEFFALEEAKNKTSKALEIAERKERHLKAKAEREERNKGKKITKNQRGKNMTDAFKTMEKGACLYWPEELAKKASEISALGPLIETQDIFLSVLKTADRSSTAWEQVVLTSARLSPNLFLKHLMVLSDIGGERLQRFKKDLATIFPTGGFEYEWKGSKYTHTFATTRSGWTNKNIYVEKSLLLLTRNDFSPEMRDVAMLLIWGSSICNNSNLPSELVEKCIIGTMLGSPNELDLFVKQRYIAVSRIIGGSTANDLGHIFEGYVVEKLKPLLPTHCEIGGHSIPLVTHNDTNLTTFDLVVRNTKTNIYVGIEISFQVTTNSVIERKAGLAKPRQDLMRTAGHKIAYIIDGSGNFQRGNAIKSILNFSDCSVNFSESGLITLAEFIENSTK